MMDNTTYPTTLHGVGLGLRREFLDDFIEKLPKQLQFLEVAPENWIPIGGRLKKAFNKIAEHYPIVCHGLSLSLGSPAPLDINFIQSVKQFLDDYQVPVYSEHLSYCSDDSHVYDLLPIPFTRAAADYVADRILQVQDLLQRRIAIENISYYCAPGKQMEEIEFINHVLAKADCDLLLDVNNIYVNSVNFGYSAENFLDALAPQRVAYIHVAGHYQEAEDLLIDTHGASVKPDVWALLVRAYQRFGALPTLVERDFNFPALDELLSETELVHHYQTQTIYKQEVVL